MVFTGTNNEEYLEAPKYLGARHRRLADDEYYPFVEEFVTAVFDKWVCHSRRVRHDVLLLEARGFLFCVFRDASIPRWRLLENAPVCLSQPYHVVAFVLVAV